MKVGQAIAVCGFMQQTSTFSKPFHQPVGALGTHDWWLTAAMFKYTPLVSVPMEIKPIFMSDVKETT